MVFKKGEPAHNVSNLIGMKFGRLTVISRAENSKDNRSMWLCRCDCDGNEKIIKGKYLLNGNTKSCGCLSIESLIKRNVSSGKRNGESYSKIYYTWYNMISRCYKDVDGTSKYYKNKGIIVCEEWKIYENFRDWSINNGFSDELSIDRIDYDGDYEPSNCRWVDIFVQANNKSTNHMITFNGETKTLMQWSRKFNLNYGLLSSRIYRGCSIEELFIPKNEYYKNRGNNQ